LKNSSPSRRAFLKSTGSLFGGSWLSLNLPLVVAATQTACHKRDTGEEFEHLDANEAAGLKAIASQIYPSDEKPGAAEIGVIWFMDAALGGFRSSDLEVIREGLTRLDAAAREHDSGVHRFSELSFDRQSELMPGIENSAFFNVVHWHATAGMFTMPAYGGNHDGLGWKLLGFDHRHVWQPPFGHYDKGEHASGEEHGD
jgi:gluconate 2-dehydrogenase gamma chain